MTPQFLRALLSGVVVDRLSLLLLAKNFMKLSQFPLGFAV